MPGKKLGWADSHPPSPGINLKLSLFEGDTSVNQSLSIHNEPDFSASACISVSNVRERRVQRHKCRIGSGEATMKP